MEFATLIVAGTAPIADPYLWLATTFRAIVADHKQSRINDLLSWNYAAKLGD